VLPFIGLNSVNNIMQHCAHQQVFARIRRCKLTLYWNTISY